MNDFQHILEGISRSFAPVVPVQAGIDPGEGYRMLRDGETILEGDEFESGGEWMPRTSTLGDAFNQDMHTATRRPIWRILASDENFAEGDEYTHDGIKVTGWKLAGSHLFGTPINKWAHLNGFGVRRKTEGS